MSPWSGVARIAELSSSEQDAAAELSADGVTMRFTSDRGGSFDVYAAARVQRGLPWGAPVRIAELSSGDQDWNAFVLPDGLKVYLNSQRSGGGSYDIWYATRASTSDSWGPMQRAAELSTTAAEGDMWVDPTDRVIVFDSTRDGDSNLFMATRASAAEPWGDPVPISELNTAAHERDPAMSADLRTLLFTRDVGGGNIDIFIATR